MNDIITIAERLVITYTEHERHIDNLIDSIEEYKHHMESYQEFLEQQIAFWKNRTSN